ncbi:hypothetical protein [Gymnodinialimonas ceratoperidinii]|uniref:Uncharacterized protein n=1 Tax=Gymnodinialimonas ceratoperidinii TaxID=2856823 RepID=A0A8F6TT55_9RHOB|nr:hypothetical protein [Gymnodinialimonas ceratoperidinii]QXT38472.1 hypothetical protein KYE46_10995 [Gymnodinialimonas ceratoperidinii]
MRYLTDSTRGMTHLFMLNTDRFLAPLLIVAALTLAGWILGISGPF